MKMTAFFYGVRFCGLAPESASDAVSGETRRRDSRDCLFVSGVLGEAMKKRKIPLLQTSPLMVRRVEAYWASITIFEIGPGVMSHAGMPDRRGQETGEGMMHVWW